MLSLLNFLPKLFLCAIVMLLSSKGDQSISNATKTRTNNDFFKLANELLDSASSSHDGIKAGNIKNADLEIGWWRKHVFGILCGTQFEFKIDGKFGKLGKNLCELLENEFTNENIAKIFTNDKETFEELVKFMSNDRTIIDTKAIVKKVKQLPILSNKNKENVQKMLAHLIAGTDIISKTIKSKNLSMQSDGKRRQKRMDNNNNNNNNNGNNGYGENEIGQQSERIQNRRWMASRRGDMCALIIFFIVLVLLLTAFCVLYMSYTGFLVEDVITTILFTSGSLYFFMQMFFQECRYAYSNSEPILPL